MLLDTSVESPDISLTDVVALGKPRLSLLVMVTAATGIGAAPGDLGWSRALLTLVSTALIVAAANALNNYLERFSDGLMKRTMNRALPAGRLPPHVALVLAVVVLVIAVPVLAAAANPLTAALGVLALLLYVGVYTPMKRRSVWALPVGAIPGAMPPLIGWTAVTGTIDPGGLALFGILFFWQLTHFIAISVYLERDYARADLKVFSRVYGQRAAKVGIIVFSALLLVMSMTLVPLGLTAPGFGIVAAILGIGLLAWSFTGLRRSAGIAWARGIFLGTIGYLTVFMAALAVST